MNSTRRPVVSLLSLLAACGPLSAAEPAPPAEAGKEVADAEGGTLKPGEFQWHPERSEGGPVLMVVSRDDQILYVYRNGVEIARSTVSTGKKGHSTPTGVFQILQKNKDHYSSTYNNAPMPYMQRLTWRGIALHAGDLPGYPASHGCIRLPFEFSKKLFGVTAMGGTVVITSEHSPLTESLKPYDIIKASGANLREKGAIQPLDEKYAIGWFPEKQETGALAIVVSVGSRVIHVLRNGVEIGRAEFGWKSEDTDLPTGVFMMLDKENEEESPVVEGKKRLSWAVVALDTKLEKGQDVWSFGKKIDIPQAFAQAVYQEAEPGTLLIFTPDTMDAEKRSKTGFVVAAGEGGVKKKEE